MNDVARAMRDAEELHGRLAAIVASSDDAIISKSLDGVIVTWNEGATRMFGYTPEEGAAILLGEVATEASGECVHRGPWLETMKCDLCGMKGQPFDVFACAVHGRCSLRRRHSKVKSCLACAERQERGATENQTGKMPV